MNESATLDLTRLADDLRQAGRDAPRNVDDVLADAANEIMRTMLALVPRRTGNLARSITVTASPGRYRIGPNGVPYASYVEYGTGSRSEFGGSAYTIEPKTASGVLAFQVGGRTIYAKKVRHPGIAPRPYVRPAAQAYLDRLGPAVADVGVEMVVGKK